MLFEATDLLPFASLFLIGFSQMMPCHASQWGTGLGKIISKGALLFGLCDLFVG
jgi:hypothetical protein